MLVPHHSVVDACGAEIGGPPTMVVDGGLHPSVHPHVPVVQPQAFLRHVFVCRGGRLQNGFVNGKYRKSTNMSISLSGLYIGQKYWEKDENMWKR